MTSPRFPRVASFKSADALRAHLQRSNIELAFDAHRASPEETPLARPLDVDGFTVGNRFCILPMEGWDGTRDGKPSELTSRRWRNFGASGAKLMWGGEAAAVRPDGRANPNQLLITSSTQSAVARLRNELIDAHRERFGSNADRDLLIGLQLTHSGRYARPHVWDRPEPMAAYHHPVLDRRFPSGIRVFTDDELDRLVEDFIAAARLAYEAGFQFVDVKQCHGYLGHELLGAQTRTGRYGGGLEKRFTFLRQVIEGIIYRYRCGLPWRDLPADFGPWQTVWKRHRRFASDGTWDAVLTALLSLQALGSRRTWMEEVARLMGQAARALAASHAAGVFQLVV